jgi:glycosyltransferase involved in cell wall biosynthesis
MIKVRRSIDLVHVHNVSWFGAFVTLFAKALRLPVITKLPNVGEFGIPGMRRRPFGLLRIALLGACDAIVAMTPESLAELDGIRYPRTRVLKAINGIGLLPARPVEARSSRTVNVTFVGRVSPEKGLPDLLYAWQALTRRAARPVQLRLVGDGPQAVELRALALSLGIAETVEFAGHCDDVPAELAKADLFVLPSYAEGNSNAILEAMRNGLPIVATRVGGASIQVGPEGEPLLVEVGDRQALGDRLLELIDDDARRVRLGIAMSERIKSTFAIDRVAAIYEQAYELMVCRRCEQIGRINAALFGQRDIERPPCAG